MNDSGEFQDMESNYRIPSQPAVVPSPRSVLSRDRSMPPDTWNLSGTQGNVFGNPRAVIGSSQTLYHGILHLVNQSATGGNTVQKRTGRPVAKGEERKGSTTPMPMIARSPSSMNSFLPVEIPQNSMVVQQKLQVSELQLHSSFSCCPR